MSQQRPEQNAELSPEPNPDNLGAEELADADKEAEEARKHGVHLDPSSELWGTVGNLNASEAAALAEFKKSEPVLGDYDALRFLRARKFDVPKALILLKESRDWMAKEKPGDLTVPLDVVKSLLRIAYMPALTLDKNGRAVLIADPSQHTTKMGVPTMKLFYFLMERIVVSMPAGVTDITVVFDMHNYSISNSDLRSSLALVHSLQVGYPERLFRCVMYMAPKVFFVLFRAVKRFMDERIVSKVQFAYSEEELHASVDKTVLPPNLGGSGPPHSQEECFKHLIEKRLPLKPYPVAA